MTTESNINRGTDAVGLHSTWFEVEHAGLCCCIRLFVFSAPRLARDADTQRDYHPVGLFDLLHMCPSTTEVVWRGFEEYVPAKVVGMPYRERLCKGLALLGRLDNFQRLTLTFDTPNLTTKGMSACGRVIPDTLRRVFHKLFQQLVALDLKGRFLLSPDLSGPRSIWVSGLVFHRRRSGRAWKKWQLRLDFRTQNDYFTSVHGSGYGVWESPARKTWTAVSNTRTHPLLGNSWCG